MWPKECENLYSPLRVIGKGAFGNVWMGVSKERSSGDIDTHVAIKVVGNDVYSQREVTILTALSQSPHPNLVRLIDDFKDKDQHVLVMSLHRGPTLKCILERGGSLGLKISQCISKQLIDAIAYLHGHAVIHRDVHPGNLIISGAMLEDDMWWSDEFDVDGKVLAMTKKCHVTLVDFGFARALTPEDIKESIKDENTAPNGLTDKETETETHSRGRSRVRGNIDGSCSRHKVRDLSALGTRNYAAPEILSGLRKVVDSISASLHRRKTKRNSSSECIADYGMVAEAYSVGMTISHMVTGIPPNADEDEFIASKNHPLKKLVRKINGRFRDKKMTREKRYRLISDLPIEVIEVIRSLTCFDERRRCTVRHARNLPWIEGNDVLGAGKRSTEVHSFMETGGPINHLSCS